MTRLVRGGRAVPATVAVEVDTVDAVIVVTSLAHRCHKRVTGGAVLVWVPAGTSCHANGFKAHRPVIRTFAKA